MRYLKTLALLVLSSQTQALTLAPKNQIVFSGNSSTDFPGCKNINSTIWCIQVWGPDNGFPNKTPNKTLEVECNTAQNCCPAPVNTTDTNYDDCEWQGCEGDNSTAYCKEYAKDRNTTVDDCYKLNNCCPVSQNSTNTTNMTILYKICPDKPKTPLSKTILFFIVESCVLLTDSAGSGLAFYKDWQKLFMGGVSIIFISAGSLVGTSISVLIDQQQNFSEEDSTVELASAIGMLLGAGIFGKGFYDKLRQNPPQNQIQQQQPLLNNNAQPYVSCCNCIIS